MDNTIDKIFLMVFNNDKLIGPNRLIWSKVKNCPTTLKLASKTIINNTSGFLNKSRKPSWKEFFIRENTTAEIRHQKFVNCMKQKEETFGILTFRVFPWK